MRAALYPWQQTRAPCSHASIREVRELHLSPGVCHQSHTSERESSNGFSLLLLPLFPLFEERASIKRGFLPVKQCRFIQTARLSSYRGIERDRDFRFGGGGCGSEPPCALLIQASPRSIRLLIMTHECKWYISQAIRDKKKRRKKIKT